MKVKINPEDNINFAVKQSTLDMKKIMEKKISQVHQKMEMKMKINPKDKITFAVKESVLEMKQIIEKKIIPVHQRMEMNMKINPVQVFGFGFDFYTVMIQTKLCLNSIHIFLESFWYLRYLST